MLKLKGSVSIGRLSGSRGDEYDGAIKIELTDETSGCIVVEIYMRPESFGEAIVGRSYSDAWFEYRPEAPIGKIRQVKEEVVPYKFTLTSEQKSKEALAPFEVDGWIGRESDLTNQHCSVKGGQRVVFVRYVDNPEVAK